MFLPIEAVSWSPSRENVRIAGRRC